MKIESCTISKLTLSEITNLDPISIYIEDFELGKGKITLTCSGRSWTAYWGNMGGRTVAEFFCRCDEGYLAGNLSSIDPEVDDPEGFEAKARKEVLTMRRKWHIDGTAARSLIDEIELADFEHPHSNGNLLQKIFGDEWWYAIPRKTNPGYEYLCRIIRATQEGLQTFRVNIPGDSRDPE